MTEVYHDTASDTLLYDLPDPAVADQLARYIPAGIALGNGWRAFPRTLPNLQVLSYFKLPVVPPVTDATYDWPIRKGRWPREHQRAMTNFMVLNPRCFNLSDMGTMKTQAALWAADFMMRQHPAGQCRALIVAPLSILQRTWGDAIFSDFLGKRSYVILTGDAKKRMKLLQQPADFYIINFDGVGVGAQVVQRPGRHSRDVVLAGLSEQIAKRDDIKICLIDEASAYRDGGTKRHLLARHILQHKPYFWPMTGTPCPTDPTDAHGLARLVNNANGESFNHYKKRVMFQVSQFQWVPRAGSHAEAYRLLQPSIRYEMRECTDVPPCTEQMRDVELSDEQAKLYKELKANLKLELSRGPVTAANQAVLRNKLIQISCGALYTSEGEHRKVIRLDAGPRLTELRTVIEEAGNKAIVFTPLTSVVHMVYEMLGEQRDAKGRLLFRGWSRAMINGEVPVKARNEIFQKFQEEKDPQIIVADPGTMSHGLDLFAASIIVWYGATDRTELYLQANRRIDRPGQTVPTTIVQLAATPIEREIFRRAANNISMQGLILDMVKEQ